MASPQTLQPSLKDVQIGEQSPTFNNTTSVMSACPTTAKRFRSLCSFDFSAVVPAGATITLATLGSYCSNSALAGRTITVYRLLRTDWEELQATWNIYKTGASWGTAGALNSSTDYTTTDAATAASVAVGTWLNETVTAQVQTALDSVSGVAHFLIADVGATAVGANSFRRKKWGGATTPTLYIEYTVPFITGINIGDVVKPIDWAGSKINIGDTWKAIAKVQVNIGDVWKDVYIP